jgi:hypothetical protein
MIQRCELSLLVVVLRICRQATLLNREGQMSEEPEEVFVGIDLHRHRWHVTVRDGGNCSGRGNASSARFQT